MAWTVVGESVAGTSHLSRNAPCQDAFRVRPFGPGGAWLALAVADGAGSAAHSAAGAGLACDELVGRVAAAWPDEPVSAGHVLALFADVRGALVAEAGRLDVRPRELACTALLAVAGPDSVTVAQIGDGAIVLGDGRGYRVAFWPEPAEYANATDFLTDERFADALRSDTLAGTPAEVALLTDGLQRVALDFAARAPYPPFFRPLFAGVRDAPDPDALPGALRGFLDSPRINGRTDDDKTLVLALARP